MKTEKDFYEFFSGLARSDPEGWEVKAGSVLGSAGPDCEKVAMLRLAYTSLPSRFPDLFAWAIQNLPDVSRPEGVSVPAFAVRFLGQRAARDFRARGILERVVWADPHRTQSALRRDGAAALLSCGTPDELQRYSYYLSVEQDAEVRSLAGESSEAPHEE